MNKPTNKSAPKKAQKPTAQVFKFEANGIKVEIPISASPAQIEAVLNSMRPKKKAQPPAEPKPAKAEVPPQPVVPAAAAPIVPATEPKPEPTKSDAPAPAPIKPTPAALPPMIEPPKVVASVVKPVQTVAPPIKREAPKPACKNPGCKSGLMPEQKADGSYHAQCRICYEEWCMKSNVPIIPRTSNGEKVICGNSRCKKAFIPSAPHHRECSNKCHKERLLEAARPTAQAKAAPTPPASTKQLATPVINPANLEKLLKKAYLNGELQKLFPEAKASPVENSPFYVRIEHPELRGKQCVLFEKAKAEAAYAEEKRNRHRKPEAETKPQNGNGAASLSKEERKNLANQNLAN